MILLPIVERELRVAARRRSTFWLRSLTAAAAMGLVLLLILFVPSNLPSHVLGRQLFHWESALAFAFCLFAGAFLTADCLSFEKREGTLGLLFLTDLRGYDLVLGKLTATSVQAVYALAAMFPMLALPMLMGGVTGSEVARVMEVLLMTVFLSLAVGMIVSALGRESRTTLLVALGILVILGGFSPVLMFLQMVLAGRGSPSEPWLFGTPVGTLIWAYEGSYTRGYRLPFWISSGVFWGLAVGALAVAGLVIKRAHREKAVPATRPGGRTFWQRLRWADTPARPGTRRGMEGSPFLWLCCRDRLARVLAWAVVIFLGGLWLCFFGVACVGRQRFPEVAYALSMIVAFVLHVGLKVVVALEAGRRFSEDKQSGALELLLVTPLSPQAIVQGQWQALRRHFRGPLLVLLAVNAVVFMTVAVANVINLPTFMRVFFGQALLLGALALLVDFYALSWVGMLMGLRSRRHNRAVLATLARILLLPWVGVVLFIIVAAAGGGVRDRDLPGCAIVWFVAGFLFSLAQAAWARGELLGRLRRWAGNDRGTRPETVQLLVPPAVATGAVVTPRGAT